MADAARLMDHLNEALPMIRIDGGYQAHDHTDWAMSHQVLGGKPTGKLALVCDDAQALAEFIELAEARGHTVEPVAGVEATVLITPSPS